MSIDAVINSMKRVVHCHGKNNKIFFMLLTLCIFPKSTHFPGNALGDTIYITCRRIYTVIYNHEVHLLENTRILKTLRCFLNTRHTFNSFVEVAYVSGNGKYHNLLTSRR